MATDIDATLSSGIIDHAFVERLIGNRYYRQVNVWAVVLQVLEFFEDPQVLGRPVPWGFSDNQLVVQPHAGYAPNAFYDRNTKSLYFQYFGDQENPTYTCLTQIIAHQPGHAINLDGIPPMYTQLSSLQTVAVHEFICDLTAILLNLFNNDIREFVAQKTEGRLEEADVLTNIAPEFGTEVLGQPFLRTAFNKLTLQDFQDSLIRKLSRR